ncbi:MAG: Coenzyme F420 hydrogenase/dehydrogenase, beta subunit C-terminal domain [Myxococcales bacterium]|nr:Coenzyme F420 hydrogenase/dehydrogenase, beta subunit C-terminal domain [Myxococcales bacterium]MDH5565562.1 Coenzyme F420 hydrogenase/dehydrogenase, beta subunit C-terminal domain [Myxococcales bacterium]
MTRVPDLEGIVSHGLCTGCGLCASLVGEDRLGMAVTSYGQMRPQRKQALDAATLDRIRAVCPGIRVRGPDLEQVGAGGVFHPVWGPVRSIQRGFAADASVRFRAAAGGALTALGVFLLESGAVDAVLHVRASESAPLLSDAQVSTSAAQVKSGAQSRYGPAAPLLPVHRLLDAGQRFAVIGKPCDVAAIRNLARIDPRVEAQIPYCLTIFCGGVPTWHTARKIAAHHGVEESEIAVFRWRGHGWPGPTHIETRDGRSYDLSYEQVWFAPGSAWHYDIQFRCKICPDAIGELGDVTCPDGWILQDGRPIHEEAPGVNLLIGRTERGERLIAQAAAAGAIVLQPCALAELDAMHADHLPRKLSHPARVAGLRSLGEPAPRFQNFRRWRMLWRAGLSRSLRAFAGTRRRVRAGAHREPLR